MARKRKQFRSAKMARRQARKRRSKISERRKKEFLWRGYSMDELKEIPLYPWGIVWTRRMTTMTPMHSP